MTGLLTLDDLSGGYGDISVVRRFSLVVETGTVTCIVGRNGVGKTTLVRLVTGSLQPRSGEVLFAGKPVTALPAHRRRAIGMGFAPQEGVVFDGLTVLENLTLHFPDRSLQGYRALFDRFPRIEERLAQRAGTLSGGEKKILSFCRAVAEDTRLVILDEPTEGVQPENIKLMAEVINEEKQSGRAFLIVEQNLNFVESVADQALVMDHGECIYSTARQANLRGDLAERIKL